MTSAVENPLALMLARFLESEDQTSLLIHGPWGSGKTYTLERFLEDYDFRSPGRYVARSTVSVFGKQTLADVQAAIFPSAQQVASDEIAKEKLGRVAQAYLSLSRFIGEAPEKKSARFFARKVASIDVPWVGRLDALALQGNYEVISDFIVVLDDLERHSLNATLKDLLGLVSDLTSQRHSKVIVICNEDGLDDEDLVLLSRFREKIFDVELGFRRSPRDVARIGISDRYPFRNEGVDIFERLGVTNIRVVKKFAFFAEQFWGELSGADPRVVRDVLEHAALLTWARYEPTVGIPRKNFAELVSGQHWFEAAMAEDAQEKTSWEQAWDAAAATLQFTSQPYDPVFVDYLLTGIWGPGSLVPHVESKMHDLRRVQAEADLKRAWKRYGDSLDPDQSTVVAGFMAVFDAHVEYLRPRDIDAAFSLLEDLGVDLTAIRDRYVSSAGDAILQVANEDWPFGGLKSKALAPVVAEASDNTLRLPTIDSALQRISIDRSWSEEDVAALASCSEDDLFRWIQSEPENLVSKIRQGLLAFRSMRSEDARYQEVGEKTERVLKRLASLSELNRVRIENLYKISPDKEDEIS